jgi:hypothetical protein
VLGGIMEEKELTTTQTIKKDVEQILGDISTDGINQNNIDYIGKLVDIHKDLNQEEYWKEKLEMRYGTYRRDYDYDDMSYGRRRRDSRGRYRGDDMLDDSSFNCDFRISQLIANFYTTISFYKKI